MTSLEAQAQDLKIGYVNLERVRVESLPAKAIEAKLHAEFSKREKELDEQDAHLRSAGQELDKIAPTLPEAERARRQRALIEQDRDLARKRREFNEDVFQRLNEERANLDEQAYIVIRRIFREEKYDLILQDALLVGPKVDITNQVIKSLGTASPAAK
jgi:outer membrane protein